MEREREMEGGIMEGGTTLFEISDCVNGEERSERGTTLA
jgi:hypothetical protein